MKKRIPVASGNFYSKKYNILTTQIEEAFSVGHESPFVQEVKLTRQGKIKAVIVPHAGYVYSGAVAACAFSKLAQDHTPEKIMLIGPNHTGFGEEISLYPDGIWQTPLGKVRVDNSWLSDDIWSIAAEDETAHRLEHSLEVQLPFLQYLYKDLFTINAITIRNHSLSKMKRLAKALLQTNFSTLVATTDLSHYEPADIAEIKDAFFIRSLEARDANTLYEEITDKGISSCGPGPVAVVALLAKALNWNIEILCHKTSGDVTGDKSSVVGYMAAIASENK